MAAPPVHSPRAGRSPCDLAVFRRNRYFYGKLLDADHFELETDYFNAKRWLLNRLVTGYGVVCGLGVEAVPDEQAIVLHPGVAIDKHGREVVVSEATPPIPIPEHLLPRREDGSGKRGERYEEEHGDGSGDEEGREDGEDAESGEGDERYDQRGDERDDERRYDREQRRRRDRRRKDDDDDDRVVHVVLCYHECPVEPAPVMVGGCHEPEPCEAGVILERYKLLFRRGCVPRSGAELRVPDVISGRELRGMELDWDRLVEAISEGCPRCPDDPCIPLAELRFSERGRCRQDLIDITVRPIVFTNDLLFQLLLSMIVEAPSYRREK